jgi:hypothetical protein
MITPAKEVAKATLTIYRNLPWAQKMRHEDAEGRPIDLTGWGAKLVIRASLDDEADLLHTFSSDLGTIVLGNGTIELRIPDYNTINGFTWRQGVGHLVLQQPFELPTVQALFAFMVRNSTTTAP